MRELSYSFIWQPWVWIKSFLAMGSVRVVHEEKRRLYTDGQDNVMAPGRFEHPLVSMVAGVIAVVGRRRSSDGCCSSITVLLRDRSLRQQAMSGVGADVGLRRNLRGSSGGREGTPERAPRHPWRSCAAVPGRTRFRSAFPATAAVRALLLPERSFLQICYDPRPLAGHRPPAVPSMLSRM